MLATDHHSSRYHLVTLKKRLSFRRIKQATNQNRIFSDNKVHIGVATNLSRYRITKKSKSSSRFGKELPCRRSKVWHCSPQAFCPCLISPSHFFWNTLLDTSHNYEYVNIALGYHKTNLRHSYTVPWRNAYKSWRVRASPHACSTSDHKSPLKRWFSALPYVMIKVLLAAHNSFSVTSEPIQSGAINSPSSSIR